MGIPYSKQINSAFSSVTPLVAAGFEVLQTVKNIAILVAAIQVLSLFLLGLILTTLLALLISVNPDLERERKAIVTPVMRWFACEVMPDCEPRSSFGAVVFLAAGAGVFVGCWVLYAFATNVRKGAVEAGAGEVGGEGDAEGEGGEGKGEGEEGVEKAAKKK